MNQSSAFAQFVALIGDAAIAWRRLQGSVREQALGTAPTIPAARPQGSIPTLKMPTAQGWAPGQKPVAAPGLKVNAFASGLKHPRWIHVLPNGDVLVAEALFMPGPAKSVFDYAMISTMKRAAAIGREPEPHHAAARRRRRRRGRSPRDIPRRLEPALRHGAAGRHLLRRQHRRRRRLSLCAPARRASPRRGANLSAFKPGGHWTRSLLAERGRHASSTSASARSANIAESGMEVEEGRACIYELDLATGTQPHLCLRPAQPGGPGLGAAHRRALDGGQRARRPRRRNAARLSDLGARRRLLRLALLLLGADGRRPRAAGSGRGRQGPHARLRARRPHRLARPVLAARRHAARLSATAWSIGQHGSWNRSKLSGYKVVFVPFENGRPAGPPRDILTRLSRAGRAGVLWTAGRRGARPRRLAAGGRRRGRRDLARHCSAGRVSATLEAEWQ